MPKTFTASERAYTKKRLREEAAACLAQYGVRKTTVDELVKRVNIPKGTFYLFYGSKELLFYEAFRFFHDELQVYLLNQINSMQAEVTAAKTTMLIFEIYQKVENSFLYQFIINGDLELVLRKLPPEVTKEHIAKDDFNLERLLTMLPGVKNDRIMLFSAALRAIFCSMLHKREIGAEVFDDVLKIMIYGVVVQMWEEGSFE
jgi:AcrR family transcriptional regulator